ncbi:MCE family protein [Mycobacterium deserti]|uniref:MCE family protein n=1 Tax=Mycobacterium deserti TaxID=2978347 RepID=A0ABT2MEN0_9MYCO|nr:MlaD family protein [Mycobacterium deserti]MCT7660734.1 MCE family protein [Mycobacterium deserti]
MTTRRIKFQLAVLFIVAAVAGTYVTLNYIRLPQLLFGLGQYTVTVQLPQSAGLYANGNVTYQGVEVGRVDNVHLTNRGVDAVLSLNSDVPIPSDVQAQVRSVSAVGELYVALQPRADGGGPPLKNGDIITASDTAVPPDINMLLDATNRGLQAIPPDNLKTVVDELAAGVGGLGPELQRIVNGSIALAADANANLESMTTLIDKAPEVMQSQADTAGAIQAWAANLADISTQLKDRDDDLGSLIDGAGPAAAEAKLLFDRLQPTVPLLLANLASGGQVALAYQPAIEQMLVLLPQATSSVAASLVPNLHNKSPYAGTFLDFNLNMNLPPPCTTGFLPAQQRRTPALIDYPDRPEGDLYCRIPQDASNDVRGARNLPCLTVPGKRAPTVKMCESDENYVPLNNGDNWKGDPNATLSGQAIPQLRPESAPPPEPAAPPPPVAFAPYDPATGMYIGPDGQTYAQTDLAQTDVNKTWQAMLLPPN